MPGATADPGFAFDNSYQRLPDRFYARLDPTPVTAPRLIKVNVALAEQLGLDPVALASEQGVAMLAGNRVPAGAEPVAMAYAGHQFGGFVPQLGDGRAILLGEVVGRDGIRRDIHLKGSGPTPFSRRGDGRAALGPVLREYIVSEAMAALGIPTTRSLAAVMTGERVRRETLQPGAVLTRVASSHVRVGTFEFFAAREDVEGLRLLADHVIDRLYPELKEAANPYLALLQEVAERQAALVARWLGIGFIHGVMNTDNMSIAGETIDYGPCAFMDSFDPAAVFSSIDQHGRYAYGNQPAIAQWNLARFAETLLALVDADQQAAIAAASDVLDRFPARFTQHYAEVLRAKFGLAQVDAGDAEMFTGLLGLMRSNHADFTLAFRHLADAAVQTGRSDEAPDSGADAFRGLFEDRDGIDAWLQRWHARIAEEGRPAADVRAGMRATNPLFIPRNHRIEAAISAAVEHDDFAPFETLVAVLARPFDDEPDHEHLAMPPAPHEIVRETFCGT